MDRIVGKLLSIKNLKASDDDDFVDRLSRKYTFTLLCFFALLVSTRQYLGDPIDCWCPAYFTSSHVSYTKTVCWVSDTYNVPPVDEYIPREDELRYKLKIGYYQWTPFILICQGILFVQPCIIWRFLSKRSGINLTNVIEAASILTDTTKVDIRDKRLRYIVTQLSRYLDHREESQTFCGRCKKMLATYFCLCCRKGRGNYLTFIYIVCKMLYTANSIGQFFLLNVFLGTDFYIIGIQLMQYFLTQEGDWSSLDRFPRVTLCNFKIRYSGRLHSYAIQCVLPINLFNEKIFIFIWFLMAILTLMTVCSLMWWAWNSFYWPGQVSMVGKHLYRMRTTKSDPSMVSRFCRVYLRRDGMHILRLVAENAGDLAAAELTNEMYSDFLRRFNMDEERSTIRSPRHRTCSSTEA